MNEKIRLRFVRNGVLRAVTAYDPLAGIIFDNETSADPLGFAVGIGPDNPIAAAAMNKVRQNEDWMPEDPFPLGGPVLDQQTLLFSGGGKRHPETSLPPQRYNMRIVLSETKLRDWAPLADVPSNGEAVVTVEEKAPNRALQLADTSKWDQEIRELCSNALSVADTQPLMTWLSPDYREPRIQRKACLLNILAKLRSLPSARPGQSFCPLFQSIHWADVDRIVAAVRPDSDLLAVLKALPSWNDPLPVLLVHQKRIAKVFGGTPADYDFISFREGRGLISLQIVVATHKVTKRQFADIDIDLGNPSVDLTGIFTHVGELIDPRRTDHLALYSKLKSGGTGDFLYYSLL